MSALATPFVTDAARPSHVIRELPILVILPHSRCNCRCMMCDIWKIRQIREITAADLQPHIASLRELKVRWVVFSGGEPLMHSDLSALAGVFRQEGIRTTLLTAGLILERHATAVAEFMDELIVSLDGPEAVHNHIRGVPDAYRRLARGIQAVREKRDRMPVHGRCTVQKHNFRHLRATVQAAHELGLDSLSFLAADTTSDAFNHAGGPAESTLEDVTLNSAEVEEFETEMEAVIRECREEIDIKFIRESPDKLRRIVLHFRAHLGFIHSTSPRCNAPWVSAVIDSDGNVRPCFFHKPIGNIQEGNWLTS